MSTTYRAAYLLADLGSNGAGTVLTAPEHADLTDDALRAEALAEAQRADIIDMTATDAEGAYPRLTRDQFNADLRIGEWRE